MTLFSDSEIEIIDRDIQEAWGKTGEALSEESHGIAWTLAKRDGRGIPYESAFLSDEPLTDRDRKRARRLAEQNGWAHLL